LPKAIDQPIHTPNRNTKFDGQLLCLFAHYVSIVDFSVSVDVCGILAEAGNAEVHGTEYCKFLNKEMAV